MNSLCVIVPTVRNANVILQYLQNALDYKFGHNFYVILVTEDYVDKDKMKTLLKENSLDGEVFGYSERIGWFKENRCSNFIDLVPKRSHAETSFGLLYMWANDFKIGIFIDDDTVPHPDFDFFRTHLHNLEFKGELTCLSSNKKFVNVLYKCFNKYKLYPRGYPYSARNEEYFVKKCKVSDVIVSQGLWAGVPDLDSITILAEGRLNGIPSMILKKEDYSNNFCVEKGNLLTLCSMNLAFKREIIPAFYQLPMDDNRWGIGRFDDIWSGFFIKKIADKLDKQIINGFPLCIHNKAERNIFRDLQSEIKGIEINETLYKVVLSNEIEGSDYFELYENLCGVLRKNLLSFGIYKKFILFMVKKMERWVELVRKL